MKTKWSLLEKRAKITPFDIPVDYNIINILTNRGIKNKKEIIEFLNPKISNLESPQGLYNINKALDIIIQAIKNNSKICIYGDYDVDGITSTSILYLALKKLNHNNVFYYIPLRDEGYGLNKKAIDEIKNSDTDLIITVDCGINSFEEVEYIKKLNMLLDYKYKELFNETHTLKLKYENFIKSDENDTEEELKERIRKLLQSKEKQDLLLGFSNYGIHKDEYIFELNGKNARYYSSQGEKKSIVFVLKVSEIELMNNLFGIKPIFLMDDITSFFDNYRKNQIINYFIEKEIQCFLTATEDLNIVGKIFIVEEGDINEKNK